MSFFFIVNPISGNHEKTTIVDLISSHFPDARIEYTHGKGDATVLAKEAGEDVIVAVGGDGTVHEVAEGLIGTDKALGIIPCGSGNGLALHLGISRNPAKAIEVIRDGQMRDIDFGYMNGEPFFCTCGIGLDAVVSHVFASAGHRGLLTYVKAAHDVWKTYRPQKYELKIDGVKSEEKAVMITVGNANQWGNNGKICPNASVSDGMLDVSIITPFKSIEIPLLALRLLTGKITDSHHIKEFKTHSLSISRVHEAEAHADGEPLFEGDTVDIEIAHQTIKAMVPRGRKI